MEAEDGCNTGLVLTIGSGQFSGTAPRSADRRRKEPVQLRLWFSPEEDQRSGEAQDSDRSGCNKLTDEEEDANNRSFNNQARNISRKKLRLTKEQSCLLEDIFKEHSTLIPTQKQELAAKLNLRPRQVEVWFQNRRARTKLKQTEVDCELLKKCFETLRDENRRLKKELQELRSVKLSASPFFVHLPRGAAAGSTVVCPSCERVTPLASRNGNVLDGSKPKLLIGALKDTSMAC